MITRKIKDAKDTTTNELVYFKGHAKATFMSDGRTVEDAINNISPGSDNTDLSNYYTKTEVDNKLLGKSDKLTKVTVFDSSHSIDGVLQIQPNIYYELFYDSNEYRFNLITDSPNDIKEYLIEFTTPSHAFSVYMPSEIDWPNNEAPTFVQSKTYLISIIGTQYDKYGVVSKFKLKNGEPL